MFSPCLCVIFNHPYPQILPVLDRVYQRRFPLVRYLMPFDRDTGRSDVITTYRGSYHHQGFVTDAAPKLRDIECTHYVFIQDDVLLNPRIDASTLQDTLDIGPHEGFIPQMGPIDIDVGKWHWMAGILWRLYYPRNHLSGTGVDSLPTMLRYLPNVEEAKARMARYGIGLPLIRRTDETFGPESVIRSMPHFSTRRSDLIEPFNQLLIESLYDTAIDRHTVEIPYPFALTAWCADFYVIPKKSFDDFAHYSGILAAAGIFAEVSVGTAMALSIDRVKTQRDKGTEFEWRWDPARDEFNLDDVLAKFENSKLVAMHPFKFSLLQRQTNALEQLIGLIDAVQVSRPHPRTVETDKREIVVSVDGIGRWNEFIGENGHLQDKEYIKSIVDHAVTHGVRSEFLGEVPPKDIHVAGVNFREHLLARSLSPRQRVVLELVASEPWFQQPYDARIYAAEAVTAFALALRGRFPRFIGSEYVTNAAARNDLYPIEFQDLTELTLPSGTYDCVITNDCLEHTADIPRCLSELLRVLRADGVLLSTFPFAFRRANIVKAIRVDGRTQHVTEPEYHGNPVEPGEGSLVFEIPGWQILDTAREVGFRRAEMVFVSSFEKGITATDLAGVLVLRCYK